MWKVFHKKWSKADEKKLLKLLDSLGEELEKDPEDESDEIEEATPAAEKCSCSIVELMKAGCKCGGV